MGPVPGHDPPVKLQNLCLQHAQLRAERSDARKRHLGHAPVARIGSDPEQLLDALAPTRATIPNSAR